MYCAHIMLGLVRACQQESDHNWLPMRRKENIEKAKKKAEAAKKAEVHEV